MKKITTKEHIIESKVPSYFRDRRLSGISPADILTWQTELVGHCGKNGDKYSKSYLRTVNNILASIFNHAVCYYGLESSPMHKVSKIGSAKADEMQSWAKDEHLAFSEEIMDKPTSRTNRQK